MHTPTANCLHSSIRGQSKDDMWRGDRGPGMRAMGRMLWIWVHLVGGRLKFMAIMAQHVVLDPRLNIWKPSVRIPNAISWGSEKKRWGCWVPSIITCSDVRLR